MRKRKNKGDIMEKGILEQIDKRTKELVDQGKLVEAGWIAMSIIALSKDAPDIQRKEMRKAFFAGAQHLFASMLAMLDSDREPTQLDLERMNQIDEELRRFVDDLRAEGH